MQAKQRVRKIELLTLLSTLLFSGASFAEEGMSGRVGVKSSTSSSSKACTGVSQKTCDSLADVNKVFDWAGKKYPDFFQNQGETFSIDGYLARESPATQLYLGSKDREIYGYGERWGGLIHFGRLETFLALIPNKGLTGKLNDTGITFGGEENQSNNTDCTGVTIQQQDCSHGRDATHNDSSDGHAGFSFTKLDSTGSPLPASSTRWACVKDNVTGLIWEVKTTDGGLRDKDWRYSWYNSTGINDGGWAGNANDGDCADNTHCDTEKFVQQVNNQGLCGNKDWRMPTHKELKNIVNFNRIHPAIDIDYFPNTNPSNFWSASPYADSSHAWHVHFHYGDSYSHNKNYSWYVRLVRTGQ